MLQGNTGLVSLQL